MGSPGERNVSVGIMSVRGFGKPPLSFPLQGKEGGSVFPTEAAGWGFILGSLQGIPSVEAQSCLLYPLWIRKSST